MLDKPPIRTLILGVGNLLLSDEGVGLRVVERLVQMYELPQEVQALDGGTLGLGLFPIDRLVVAASFTQNWPERFVSEDLRLKVISSQIEVLAAGRISIHPIDVRLGVSWSVDLRSYSTTSLAETIEARPDGFIGIHSLGPFLVLAWTYRERIGVFGRVGANLALNETVYRIARDGPTETFEPFFAKLFYQVGFVVRI